MRVFVAGAAGAIGQRLVPQLVAAGHVVVATTRSQAKIDGLRALGAEPVVLDGLDAVAVGEAVGRAEPDVIVHQMTSLAGMGVNLRKFDRYFATTNELRTAGTGPLVGRGGGLRSAPLHCAELHRVAEQPAGRPGHDRAGSAGQCAAGSATADALRDRATSSGRSTRGAAAWAWCCARLAVRARRVGEVRGDDPRRGSSRWSGRARGVWSFARCRRRRVGDGGRRSSTEAQVSTTSSTTNPPKVSVWLPYVARVLGAPEPRHLPVWLARLAAGEVAVSMTTQIRGSANDAAKRRAGLAAPVGELARGFPVRPRA